MPFLAMGIDQSLTCTGVVITKVYDNGDREVTFSTSIMTQKDPKLPPLADTLVRAKDIANQLLEIIEIWKPDLIGLENLSYGSVGNATRNLAILFGVICTTLGIDEPKVVPPTTLKKFATGNGKATKADMLNAVQKEDPVFHSLLTTISIKGGRYDLADAFWIARWIENEDSKNP